MGIDVNVHMNPEFNAKHVVNHLEGVGAKEVELSWPLDFEPDYFTIAFTWGDEDRVLHFHCNLGIFKSHKLSVGAWGSAEEIMEGIVEKFGGVFVPNDCEDNAVIYDQAQYNTGNGLFVHKWALAHGYIEDSRVEDIVEARRIFKEKIG